MNMTDTKKPNRKRKIAKRIWLNEKEERELKRKAKKAGVSQSGLVRSLIRGYEPKEKPGKEFFEALRQLSAIGNNVHQLAAKANALSFIDAPMLHKEVKEWRAFRADIVLRFISPDGG